MSLCMFADVARRAFVTVHRTHLWQGKPHPQAPILNHAHEILAMAWLAKEVKEEMHVTGYAGAILQSGKTKFSIENATKTRVVLADTRIHILGSFQNIRVCRYLIQSHMHNSAQHDGASAEACDCLSLPLPEVQSLAKPERV